MQFFVEPWSRVEVAKKEPTYGTQDIEVLVCTLNLTFIARWSAHAQCEGVGEVIDEVCLVCSEVAPAVGSKLPLVDPVQ